MNGKSLAQILLARVLIPISLLAASILRQNLLSLVYFILLLVSPLIPRHKHAFDGPFRAHILVVMIYSVLVVLAELVFQLYLLFYALIHDEHYGYVLHPDGTSCELTNTLQWIGFERVDAPKDQLYHSFRLLLPDVIILVVSAITFGVLTKLYKVVDETDAPPTTRTSSRSGALKKYVESTGEFTIFLLLGASAAMVPSVISAFYFLLFFGVLVYYSLHLPFNPKSYGVLKLVIFVYVSCHMLLLYFCQMKFLQTWLDEPDNVYYSRLIGMTSLVFTDCESPWGLELEDHTWPYFVNPAVLFLLFTSLSMDYAYRRDRREVLLSDNVESSPLRRTDSTRSSEHQLLTHEQQPCYDAIRGGSSGADEPDFPDIAADDAMPQSGVQVRKTWNSIYNVILSNSHLLAFFAMLGWAVVYPSWTAFVFLVLGCILWLFPDSRKATFISSPLLVVYSISLCILQYVCSLNYGGIDYNTSLFFNATDNYIVTSIGLKGYDYPASVIMVKMLFTMMFCVVLRQLRRENCFARGGSGDGAVCLSALTSTSQVDVTAESTDPDVDTESVDNLYIVIIGRTTYNWISKYWIIVFYVLLILMAIQEPYAYRVVYMVLFLFSAIVLQIHYPLWRYTLKVFLIVVAIYSIIAILMVYVLSFHEVLIAFQDATNISSDWLTDLGFDPSINYQEGGNNALLLVRLIVPAFLLVTVMLQIHVFHDTFMNLTDPAALERYMIDDEHSITEPPPEIEGGFVADFVNFFKRLTPHAHKIIYAILRLLTIHLYKVFYIVAAYIVTTEASAFGFILLVLLNLSLFFDPVGLVHKACLILVQFWIGIIILARMLFQLNSVPADSLMANCTAENATFLNGTVIPPEDPDILDGEQNSSAWLGLKTLYPEGSQYSGGLPKYIGGYVGILIGFTALAVFRVHDFYRSKVIPAPKGITFPLITQECIDSSFVQFIGYLINYGFIRFGLEICFVCSVVVIDYRQDMIGAIYVVLLAILLILNMYRRKYVRYSWFIYMVILGLLLPAQYFSSLGIPPTLCVDYPWVGTMRESLRIWLYLPSYSNPPSISILLADCIQLLFVSLQYRVFIMEAQDGNTIMLAAGTNEEFDSKPPARFKDMHDFVDTKRNLVDVIFSTAFSYWFWVCISMLFITGTQNINLYCFGYLVSSFYFFWHGLDFMTKHRTVVMRIWNTVLFYNFVVILLKTWLQIVGCVFLEDLLAGGTSTAQEINCYPAELFSIKCLNSQLESDIEVCGVSKEESGLTWDILCFVALLFQRRVFMSTYFLIVVCEERAQATLSSRGAELINNISAKRIAKQNEKYEKEMVHIRKKLERIRLRTLRLEGGVSREDWTHFDDDEFTGVIRSGDGTMFEEEEDDETTITDVEIDDESQAAKASPAKMLVATMESGMEKSVQKRKLEKSQRSMDRSKSFDDSTELVGDHGDESKETAEGDEGTAEDLREGSGDHSGSSTHLQKVGDAAQTTDAWFKQFVVECVKWVINRLNEISHDYRTVASQIDHEQVVEKEKERERMLSSSDDHIEPTTSSNDREVESCDIQIEEYEERWQEALEKKSLTYRLFNALYLACIARTELICYFAMILNHLCYGTLLSLPLPLVATIWGMFSIPRPAKTFWIVVLTYAMAIVMVKYLFQFSFWPWTEDAIINWSDPRLLFGVESTDTLACTLKEQEDCSDITDSQYYALYELLLLLAIFVHRSVLKRYGLWRNETEQSEDLKKLRAVSVAEPMDSALAIEESSSPTPEHEDLTSATFESSPEEGKKEEESSSVIGNWYRNLMSGKVFTTGDYYAPMVFCDFLNFIISIFCYNAFGSNAGGNVQDYLESNQIPPGFLILLLVQFASIVVDRALYLQKSVFGKLVYTLFMIVVIHVYTMFILPTITSLPFNQNTPSQLFYFIKCIYFGFSAWQVKSGYPRGVLGNFLTTKYTLVNLVLFEAFILCPFLLELRCVMDWIWTKSAMSLSTWFVMEDIFSKIFILKCMRQNEANFPAKRAHNKGRFMKYGFGGFVLVALIFVIWLPLLLFSFANTIYNVNTPVQCKMKVAIGGFQDIFSVSSQSSDIRNVTADDYKIFKEDLSRSSGAAGFLNTYEATDLTKIKLSGESTAIWGITAPSELQLLSELAGNDSVQVTVTFDFTRKPKEGLTAGTITTQYFYELGVNSTARKQLYKQISNTGGLPVDLAAFLPRYIVLPVSGLPYTADALHCEQCTDKELEINKLPYHGLSLQLHNDSQQQYWMVKERDNYTQEFPPEKIVSLKNITYFSEIYIVTFSQRVAPDVVSVLTGPGIIGLYIGLVLVVGQLVRTLTSGGSYVIMFNDLPNVEKIMKLCKDLYFVRENGELDLEEELYAKLVFLYRSPPTMIEWTKKST